MLKATTGLEGGLVAHGSTCGVVSGGALSLALLYDNEIRIKGADAEEAVVDIARNYVSWFDESFGSTRCDGRTGVDFYTAGGQVHYFLPGDRIARCFNHIGKAADKLYGYCGIPLPAVKVKEGTPVQACHCARSVLEAVRKKTGVGDDVLERTSFVLDGGMALSGGVCGALAGAVMAINLVHGLNVRGLFYGKTVQAFVTGHLNLLRKNLRGMPEPFGMGKEILDEFIGKAGSIDCRTITGTLFRDYASFKEYLASSGRCASLIEAATNAAVGQLKKWGLKE